MVSIRQGGSVTEQLYNIVFKGETLDGVDQASAQANMAKLFKLSTAKINQQFFSQPCYLKKSITKATAAKYQAALKKAGLKIYIKPQTTEQVVANAPLQTNSTTPEQAPPPLAQPTTESEPTYGLSLAPMEGNLLKQSEQKPSIIKELDLSAYSLAAQEGYLVDPQELPNRDYPLIEIPDLQLIPLT